MDEMNEILKSEELSQEYETAFTPEERVSNALKVDKGDFNIEDGVVEFNDILIPEPIKQNRKETYMGLSTSVAELGILNPIHVMVSEGYADWVEGGSEGVFEGIKYILLDGFRRIWAGYKNGLTRSKALIWDFKDKDKGVDLAVTLSLVLNKKQKHSWSEIWYMYKILESESAMTPGTLEYLLQLEPGDSMKLKDIMLSGYSEIIDDLLSDKKSIQQAYSALQKARKEEDQLLKEDNQGIAKMEQADGLIEKAGDSVLSNDEVKEILEMDEGSLELKEDDFDEMLKGVEPEVQKTGERHPLDPALKAESLLHDNYQCVCCGMGKYLPMRYKLGILQSHHKVSVAHGGPDDISNLATLCVSCHTLVHLLLWSGLKFGMSKDEFLELPEEEQNRLKNIMAIAKKDYEAAKRLGKTVEDMKKENSRPSTFKMPGTDMRENAKAIRESGIGPESRGE